jgi:hypothetical protein
MCASSRSPCQEFRRRILVTTVDLASTALANPRLRPRPVVCPEIQVYNTTKSVSSPTTTEQQHTALLQGYQALPQLMHEFSFHVESHCAIAETTT